MYIQLIVNYKIDSEAEAESPVESPPVEFSDWDGFSDTLSFDSASDAFTDNHTDSEPEEIDTQWLYATVEEWATDQAQRRYQRRRSRHIRERDQRRRLREIEGLDFASDDYILVDTWTNSGQDTGQDEILAQILAEIQGQGAGLGLEGQDTRPQKRQYSIDALDSIDLEPSERRYPSRKRRLTIKAAALILE
jgi:hypothetical protein